MLAPQLRPPQPEEEPGLGANPRRRRKPKPDVAKTSGEGSMDYDAACAEGRQDFCFTGKFTERGIVGAHGFFGEPAEEFGGIGGLAPGVDTGLAVFQRDQMGEVVEPGGHQLPRFSKHLGTLSRGSCGPVGHGAFGGVERGIRLCGAGRGNRGENLFGRGVQHVEAFGRGNPRAVDPEVGVKRVDLVAKLGHERFLDVRAGAGADLPPGPRNR